MKAAWDWHLPRTTADEERALVTFAHGLGFDTLILHEPTPVMMEMAHALDMKVAAIVTPNGRDFGERYPDALQQMLPVEDAIGDAIRGIQWEPYTIRAHHWFPLVQMGSLLCFEHPAAQAALKERVSRALAVADGVAFDGFGFANHYACFCATCQGIRQAMAAAKPERHEAELLATMSEATLITISEVLYAHAKTVKPDALVTNHLWPPFRPNPYYGNRLKLDYCSQTISWFYKPNWSLARVEFEAQEMKRLEVPERNRFVPFIAMFHEPYLARTGERIAQELQIAQRYGDGHLIFCTLKAIQEYPAVYSAVRAGLTA
ncbi:MAG: hypothetical protein KDE53_19615 [Caldilineaceae bacterium]|nr:hypothetical protein [Caldilineaceae bacterium]